MTATSDVFAQTPFNKIIAKQAHIGVLTVKGNDAEKFLQGQLTCDLTKLSDSSGLYGAICNVKGRIISNFFLLRKQQDILMVISQDVLEKTLNHLKKYAVFFKVELINSSTDYAISTHIQASDKPASNSKLAETLSVTQDESQLTCELASYPMQVEWRIQSALDADIIEQEAHLAEPLQLLMARPLITEAQSEETLPQWLNMQSNGGISFTKGCYTGQEIIARMQYRGKSKKQLALISWQGEIGDSLDILDDNEKVIGHIFNHAAIGQKHIAQVILNITTDEVDTAFYMGQPVDLVQLPYALD
ncbi:CAF17-like 4Fe-4S cluster assembly/insertion protein YgfZ [Marinomonas dokdonensis]|uniref:CAF17-like 4Fe-4S cluster assembly/insertion protein YgfZ n=1 Tax=Marinomonas dokdonensis TaxID=328224 RepID=UPI0040554B26